jgi:hypothetical protein
LVAHPLGELVGGDKKDVVISNIIYGYPAPGRVVIYGWHYTSGTAIQPMYNGHEETYADYSHGIRLVQMNMLVNGVAATVSSVLQSTTISALLSDEGSIAVPRYPVAMPSVAVPSSFAVLNHSNTSLRILASAQPDVTHFLVQHSSDGLSFSAGQLLQKDSMEIGGFAPNIPVYVRIAAVSIYDTSAYSEVLGAVPTGCTAPVLIVNAFDRPSAGNTRDFIRQHGNAFAANGFAFISCTNDAIIVGLIPLDTTRIADYILGNESTANETFNAVEQSLVEAYLRQGGFLLVSGAEIGWDLQACGNSIDRNFYNNYLKASYTNDAPNGQSGVYYQAQPTTTSLFSGLGTISFDNGTHGTYNVNYPDVISPLGGASVCLEYSGLTANYAGICYTGCYDGSLTPGKIINLGIPFETIYPETARTAVMQDVLAYFNVSPSGIAQPVITQSNDTLYSSWNGLQQWFFNGVAISGAISNFYVATLNGDYSLIAEDNACYSDTSAVVQVSLTGIAVNDQLSLKVFPNPCRENLHIQIGSYKPTVWTVTMSTISGTCLLIQECNEYTDLSLTGFPAGIYILSIESDLGLLRSRIIKL